MRALIQSVNGKPEEVLSVQNRPEPGEVEVLVKVRATSVHADIWHAITGPPYVLCLFSMGLHKPKSLVPGSDLAGLVEAAGRKVARFNPDDGVFGESDIGRQMQNDGSYAKFAVAPHHPLTPLPPYHEQIE